MLAPYSKIQKSSVDFVDKKEFRINERRLAKRLNVHHFMKPPDYRIPFKSYIQDSNTSNLKIRIPFLRFPQWHYCINRKCSLMTKVQLTEATNKPKCKECGTRIVQAPLVAICQDGHIDDFESALMRKMVGLFHLTGKDSSLAKENAQKFINIQNQ